MPWGLEKVIIFRLHSYGFWNHKSSRFLPVPDNTDKLLGFNREHMEHCLLFWG